MNYRVPSRLIMDLWPAIEPHATRACRWHPFLEAPDLLAILLAGRAQLFLATNAEGVLGFAAVEMIEYPRRKVANVLAAAGARGFLSVLMGELLDDMQKWSIEQGADTFAALGRPGWMRTVRGRGSDSIRLCLVWEGLGNGRRRRQDQDDHRAVEAGSTLPDGHLRAGEDPIPADS